jgi:hypothetical protein
VFQYGAVLAQLGKKHVFGAERVQRGVGVEGNGGVSVYVEGERGGSRGVFGGAGCAQEEPEFERMLFSKEKR